MIDRKQITASLIVFSLAIVLLTVSGGECGDRIPSPEGVFIYKSASNVFGYEAAWVNPAGLGRFQGSGLLFMADYLDGDMAKSWGAMINGEQSAIAYRRIENPSGPDYKEYIFASGMGLGQLTLGGSYRYFKEGPGVYDNRHFWNLGLLMRGQGQFSLSAVFSNLNRGRINGERSQAEQRYSVSYRPLEDLVTFSVDVFKTTSISFSDADYVYHLSVDPYPGLTVEGLIDSHQNFNLGVRANLLQYFTGIETRFKKGGGERGTTFFLGSTDLRQPSLIPWRRRRLMVDVTGGRSENPPRPVFGKRPQSFFNLVSNIYRAADDASISEIVLKLRRPAFGLAQAQELREALKYFKSKDKTIVCHLSMPNNIGYYIGSVGDRILIPPVSQLNLVGLKAELTFYAGTFSKLGVEFDFVKIGEYKTAAERYTQRESSEENKYQINRILDDLFDQFVTDIADGRNIQVDSVLKIIDNGPFTSAEAIHLGLVDGLSYVDELHKDFLSTMPEISFRRYQKDTLMNDGWPAKPKLAVVVAEGEINFDGGGMFPWGVQNDVTPSKLRKAFSKASGDSDIRGIVFRVNSPGGFALAGEEIFHAAEKASREKPFVVSMSNLAASGGYYIAMAADKLYADPGTITGSIGIYGGKLNLSNLYEKIDLGKELYTRGRFAGMMSSVRPFTEDEREKQLTDLRAFYDYFVELVAANRRLSPDSVDALARGKVWTGREAVQNGLIDEMGGLKKALDDTAEKLGLDDYRVVFYPEKRPLFLLPGRSLFSSISSLLGIGSGNVQSPDDAGDVIEKSGIYTRMPFDLSIE